MACNRLSITPSAFKKCVNSSQFYDRYLLIVTTILRSLKVMVLLVVVYGRRTLYGHLITISYHACTLRYTTGICNGSTVRVWKLLIYRLHVWWMEVSERNRKQLLWDSRAPKKRDLVNMEKWDLNVLHWLEKRTVKSGSKLSKHDCWFHYIVILARGCHIRLIFFRNFIWF